MGRVVARVPVAWFGIVLGVAGLGGSWRAAVRLWDLPAWIAEAILAVGAAVWLILLILYALKWLTAREAALAEARHPVLCCFISLVPVATLLISVAAVPHDRGLAIALFALGALGQLGFGLWRTGRLWQGGRDVADTTPIMYLPLGAGNFVTAIAAGALGWHEVGQLFFGAGFFACLALESVILYRLYTAPPLPPPLRASLGIQPAPALVGLAAYLAVTIGPPDMLAHMLLGYGLLQIALLLRLLPWLCQQPFGPAYWAYSFAIAALATASLGFAARAPRELFSALAIGCFGFANLVIAVLALGTLALLARGKLLPPG
jgi:tellurite resistance protein